MIRRCASPPRLADPRRPRRSGVRVGAADARPHRLERRAGDGALGHAPLGRVGRRRVAARLRARAALGHRDARPLDAREPDDPRLRGGAERRLRHRTGGDLRPQGLLGDEHRRQLHGLPALDGHADATGPAPTRLRVGRVGRAEADRPRRRDRARACPTPSALPSRTSARRARGSSVSPSALRCDSSPPGRGPARPACWPRSRTVDVVLLSRTGAVLRTDEYDPGSVRAIALGLARPARPGRQRRPRRERRRHASRRRADARLPPARDRLPEGHAGPHRATSRPAPTACSARSRSSPGSRCCSRPTAGARRGRRAARSAGAPARSAEHALRGARARSRPARGARAGTGARRRSPCCPRRRPPRRA